MTMFWYNNWQSGSGKYLYEELLQNLAQQITEELLDMYLRGVPTDKTFDELLAQRLPPHYSKHKTEIGRLANRILGEKGYYNSYKPGKFLETPQEYQREQTQYYQQMRSDRQRLIPQARVITQDILTRYWQNGERNANFAEMFYAYAQEAAPQDYLFILEYVIESIQALGYTIHSLVPFEISLTFYNTRKPDPPAPQPPANPLRTLFTKLLG